MGFQFGNLLFVQSQAALFGPPGFDVFDTARSLGPLARGVSQFFVRAPRIAISNSLIMAIRHEALLMRRSLSAWL